MPHPGVVQHQGGSLFTQEVKIDRVKDDLGVRSVLSHVFEELRSDIGTRQDDQVKVGPSSRKKILRRLVERLIDDIDTDLREIVSMGSLVDHVGGNESDVISTISEGFQDLHHPERARILIGIRKRIVDNENPARCQRQRRVFARLGRASGRRAAPQVVAGFCAGSARRSERHERVPAIFWPPPTAWRL